MRIAAKNTVILSGEVKDILKDRLKEPEKKSEEKEIRKSINIFTLQAMLDFTREIDPTAYQAFDRSIGSTYDKEKEGIIIPPYFTYMTPRDVRENASLKLGKGKESLGENIYNFYAAVFLVAMGKIKKNQYCFTDNEVAVVKASYLTKKFVEDHAPASASKNKLLSPISSKDAKKEAKKVSAKRGPRVPKSTVIRPTKEQLQLLTAEAKSLNQNGVYKTAHQIAREEAARQGLIVRNLFFKTKSTYTCDVRLSTGKSGGHPKTQFFYSVAEKDEQFYIHHFEGTELNKNSTPIKSNQDVIAHAIYMDPQSDDTMKLIKK